MLEHQQTKHHLGRRAQPSAAAALGAPLCQRLVHRSHDFLVSKHSIGVVHPLFAKITHFLGDQPIAKAELRPPHLNHLDALVRLRCGSGRSSS